MNRKMRGFHIAKWGTTSKKKGAKMSRIMEKSIYHEFLLLKIVGTDRFSVFYIYLVLADSTAIVENQEGSKNVKKSYIWNPK